MTDRPDLDRIEAYCDAATPGPWRVRRGVGLPGLPGFVEAPRLSPSHPFDIEVLGEDDTLYSTRDADLEMVAHARTDLPAVVAYARRLEAENQRLRAELGYAISWFKTSPSCSKCSTWHAMAQRAALRLASTPETADNVRTEP